MKQKKNTYQMSREPMHFPPKNPPLYDAEMQNIPTDILGSYTGKPLDRTEPEQDVDDL